MSRIAIALLVVSVLVVLPVGSTALTTAHEPAAAIGQQLEGFELRDFRGKTHRLADFQQNPVVVIAFLGTECPLALQYAPRLTALSKQFADRDVAVIGIDANQQDSITEMAAFAKSHEIDFPLLKDLGNKVADQLQAERTPEVFVLDTQRVVRYRGRIDDQYLVGRQRPKPTREDLRLAIEEVLSGKPVSQATTEVAGCRIGRVHLAKAGEPASVTYAKDIAPLLNQHCVECHRPGEIAPFALTSYSEVAGWADTMLEVVRENRMPPWHANPEYGHFSNDRRLSDDQRQLLERWVATGAPEGNPRDLPAQPQFAEGWRLPRSRSGSLHVRSGLRRVGRRHGRLQVLRRRSGLH